MIFKMYTAGLYAVKLTPFMGNKLVCKLVTYRWNGDEWKFKSLEAVYFKDLKTREEYLANLLRRLNYES